MKSKFNVYYDGQCSACVTQVEKLRAADRSRGRLNFIDCAVDNFRDEAAERDAISQSMLRRVIHVRTPDGVWFRGAQAIAEIFDTQEATRAARFWRSPVAVLTYRLLVVARPLLSRLGAPQMAHRAIRNQARRIILSAR